MVKKLKSGLVAIAGRPNSGKSTLINRIMGSKISIVSPKAQTTRERVLGILTEPDLGQILFVDTPGIHKARPGGINDYMVKEAKQALEGPSAIWYLVDPTSKIQVENAVLEILKSTSAPVWVLLNKIDLISGKIPLWINDLTNEMKELGINLIEVLSISALEGTGVAGLLKKTWNVMPEGELHFSDPDQISDRPMRYFAAERIREQLLAHLGDELPYSCAVQIEKFDETCKPPRIEALVWVERESQKPMVIGKGGSKIKQIGTDARADLETFMGQKIFLGLRVKVLKDWTKNQENLKNLGYSISE